MVIRKDNSCGFIKKGLIFVSYRFWVRNTWCDKKYNEQEYLELLSAQKNNPVALAYDSEKNKRWWMYCDEFYWDNEGLNALEVRALIYERQKKKEKRIKNAITLMESDYITSNKSRREPIPEDVRLFVWKRDGGKCVKCGSNENLEFDHIIPISKGGSNTARNIQLLCEHCNRSKGANLV